MAAPTFKVDRETLNEFMREKRITLMYPDNPHSLYGLAAAYFVEQNILDPDKMSSVWMSGSVDNSAFVLPNKEGQLVTKVEEALEHHDKLRAQGDYAFTEVPVRPTYEAIAGTIGPYLKPISRARTPFG